eukprot:CAMPEP_0205905254 /NCGR_PEP_ID=MMETSP1325-20131115/1237_1 /ASSEMBLY_ACC=CAM_ASM_000708 /TAXON_ID=236786 /ORGANISM="Florenciella sp., Strain RCC1007" /LENGTH=48 /DNA_ID= /DNA_START= /DNA_END= /DNA_ORIENTATION=
MTRIPRSFPEACIACIARWNARLNIRGAAKGSSVARSHSGGSPFSPTE